MTDKLRKKARELQAKTGMSYAAAKQQVTPKTVTRDVGTPEEQLDKNLLEALDEIKARFCDAVSESVAQWYSDESLRIVGDQSDVTMSLSDDNLRSLKSEVLELISNTHSKVQAYISVDSLWWHCQVPLPIIDPQSTKAAKAGICHHLLVRVNKRSGSKGSKRSTYAWNYYSPRDEAFPDFIDVEIRKILDLLEVILRKYGYQWKDNFISPAVAEFWYNTLHGPFGGTFVWSQEMKNQLNAYHEIQTKIVSDAIIARSVQYDTQREEAKKRWDAVLK